MDSLGRAARERRLQMKYSKYRRPFQQATLTILISSLPDITSPMENQSKSYTCVFINECSKAECVDFLSDCEFVGKTLPGPNQYNADVFNKYSIKCDIEVENSNDETKSFVPNKTTH
jgi:phosphorylcholine metabolism protein LicD